MRACRERDTNVVFRINLLQPLQLRLGGDELAFKDGRAFDHRPALLFDIDGAVFAGELAEIFFRGFEVLLDLARSVLREKSARGEPMKCSTR